MNFEKLSKLGESLYLSKFQTYFTLLYSHTPVEHRPSVFSFHRWRFLAWARSSPNDVFPHSAKTVRLQVALGRPRDLLPCGFHSNALWQISFWLFRRVCPSQPYFLRFIFTSIFDCPVLSHSSSLDIICGHQIPRMFRRHLLTKAWSFCVVLFVLFVTNQVSQPYSRTDFTNALNNLILRCKLMLLALQTFKVSNPNIIWYKMVQFFYWVSWAIDFSTKWCLNMDQISQSHPKNFLRNSALQIPSRKRNYYNPLHCQKLYLLHVRLFKYPRWLTD